METATLTRRLTETSVYDMNVHAYSKTDKGWKISIQGKTVSDSVFLYERLSDFLIGQDIPFKVATVNRYSLRNTNKEQSFKAMTIYCPNGLDIMDLCESVYSMVVDYKGWYSINTPKSYSHFAGGLFYRNDRNESGNYIPAN
jgi:hypothetical protein